MLSTRVSAEAFCRTVVARVAVRDPGIGGVIKVCPATSNELKKVAF